MATYSYSISGDTLNGILDAESLDTSIRNSAITVALDYISSLDDALSIVFKASLSAGEQTTLDGIVSAHDGVTANEPQVVNAEITATPPFAKPDYRTKRDATSSWITVTPDSTEIIDYLLTEERYVTGGEIIFKNSKQGDYITAEVYDKDSIIPEPYRAALCESWPSVSKYVVKKWIVPTASDGYGSFLIDTYPLNAKITAGLYLRVSYVTTSELGSREVAINYHLTKKLA